MDNQNAPDAERSNAQLERSSSSFGIDSRSSLNPRETYGASHEWSPPLWKQRLDALGSFCLKHFLPLGLVTLVVFGALVPAPGKALSSGPTSEICIAIIFVISGLTLKTADVMEAIHEWPAFLIGVALILGVTPLLSLLAIELPLVPDEFPLGLAIFTCMPTTLSSGVVLTQQAGGNFALALMMTVVTNLLGVALVPFLLSAYVASGSDISISPLPLLRNLVLTILLPLIVGKLLRQIDVVTNFVAKHKKWFSLASSFFLILVPWMRVSDSSSSIADIKAGSIFAVVLAGASVHFIYLLFNYAVATVFQLKTGAKKAVVLLSSQKTLPVAITVINFLDEDEVGEAGIIAIPAIISHISQIVIDSFIVGHWKRSVEAKENEARQHTIASSGNSECSSPSAQPASTSVITANENYGGLSVGYPVDPSGTAVVSMNGNSADGDVAKNSTG